jgi:hypothetical protein
MAVNLRDRIAATLDPNADIRRSAELDLKYVRLPNLAPLPVERRC